MSYIEDLKTGYKNGSVWNERQGRQHLNILGLNELLQIGKDKSEAKQLINEV